MFYLISLVVAVALAGGAWFAAEHRGHAAGFAERDGQCKVQLAEIESRAIEAERQSTALREKGRILGDRLAEQAAAARAAITEIEGRMNRAIKTASATRRALDTELVRALNEQTPIRETVSRETGTAAARTDAKDAAPAADRTGSSGGASEQSVARWIVAAKTGYDTCRTNLHALQDWVRGVTQ